MLQNGISLPQPSFPRGAEIGAELPTDDGTSTQNSYDFAPNLLRFRTKFLPLVVGGGTIIFTRPPLEYKQLIDQCQFNSCSVNINGNFL